MLITKRALSICYLLLLSSTASAIPPPDVIVSLWQSILQMAGMLSVFAVGAYYSVKQFFGYTLSTWKRPLIGLVIILSALGIVVAPYTHFFNAGLIKTPSSPVNPIPPVTPIKNSLIQGEKISLDEIFKRDTDDYTREWKRNAFQEMLEETAFVRKKAKLPALDYQTITSFSPLALQQHITTSPDELFFLDVRGAYERKMFYLPFQASTHYGDLLNDILPKSLVEKLPKNKRIVVLCHSGLRGYIASNLLLKEGYKNVSFLQGGLANWNKQKLPINGNENYSENLAVYPVFSEQDARELSGLQKIEIDPGDGFIDDIEGLIDLPFETSPTKDLMSFIEQSKSKPILMICRGYGGCFHTLNFGHLIEQSGGKVAGVFDRTGEFIIPPITE